MVSTSEDERCTAPESGVAELVTRLENIIADDRLHQGASFPSHLFDALLRDDIANSQHLNRLVSTLDQNRERIREILHRDSLRLLAYVLLNSEDTIEQESGLYMLLDGPTQTNEEPLSSSNNVPSISNNLVTALLQIFLDKPRDLQCRRVAGKLIVGLMTESSETGLRILQSEDLVNYCPRVISIVCHETDIVLKFFASTIIRILRTTGTDKSLLWTSRESKYKSIFFKFLQKYPDNWIQSFHSYTNEVGHHESRKTRARSRDERSGTIKESPCHLVSSVAIDTRTYSDTAILALSTPDRIILILPNADYIEIPVQNILEPIHHVPKRKNQRNHAPSLEFEATGSILLNGRQQLSKSSVYITANEDLHELRDVLTDAKKKAQKQSRATRRISSTVVVLDTAEEVATKSSQCRDTSSQAANHEMDLSADEENDSCGEPRTETSRTKQYELHAMSDLSRQSSGPEESSRITTEDVEVPAEVPGSGNETPLKEAAPNPEHGDMDLGKRIPSPRDATESPGEHITSPMVGNNGSMSSPQAETIPAEHITDTETAIAAPTNSQPKRCITSNRRLIQRNLPLRRSPRGRASSRKKGRPALPNTQESLLFPRMGRPSKKIYTSRSKRAVDWEEDLRPTEDEEEAARIVRNESELTSVPSPSPGDTSIFSRRPNTAQKKRKARAAPSLAKGKRSAKGKRAVINRRGRTPRLLLQTNEPNANNVNGGVSIDHGEMANDLNENAKADDCTSSRPHSYEGKENTFGLASRHDNGFLAARIGQSLLVDQGNRDSSTGTPLSKSRDPDATKYDGQTSEEDTGEGSMQIEAEQVPAGRMEVPQESPEQTERRKDNDNCLSSTHEEQTPVEGTASRQRLQAADVFPNNQCESDQLQGSGDFQALFITQNNELEQLPPSAENDHTRDTHIKTIADGNGNNHGQSRPEGSLLLRSRKRAATQGTTDERPSRKSQMTDVPVSDYEKSHELEDVVERDEMSNQGDVENSSDVAMVEKVTSPLTRSISNSPLSEMETDFDFEHTPAQEGQNRMTLPTSNQKKSIVDENGSPRLASRHVSNDEHSRTKKTRQLRLERWRDSVEDASSQSGYHGDSNDGVSLESTGSDSIFASLKNVGSFKGSRLEFRSATTFADDANGAPQMGSLNTRLCLPGNNARGQSAKESNRHVESMITPYSVSVLPREATHGAERVDRASPGLSSATTIRLPQEPMQLGIHVKENSDKANWQAALEAIQKTTHGLLLQTSERLGHQLESEKDTISQVLNSYQQGCHQVMDQLFKAHEERIELYRQQMASVRKQHSDMCQNLIRRLEDNDRRIQERLCSGV